MIATHRDAENRYTIIRRAVIQQVNRSFTDRDLAELHAKLIDHAALTESALWNHSPHRRVTWDWMDGYQVFKFRYPKRFEMALWHHGKLASLTLGRPTYNGSRMRLDLIEANPERPDDLKVFRISLAAVATYAEALGASEVRIMNPINDEVRHYYESFGLIYVPKHNYLYTAL